MTYIEKKINFDNPYNETINYTEMFSLDGSSKSTFFSKNNILIINVINNFVKTVGFYLKDLIISILFFEKKVDFDDPSNENISV